MTPTIELLQNQLTIAQADADAAWKTAKICEKDRQLWENRYRKLKTVCWSQIRLMQDQAKKGADFDKLLDELEVGE